MEAPHHSKLTNVTQHTTTTTTTTATTAHKLTTENRSQSWLPFGHTSASSLMHSDQFSKCSAKNDRLPLQVSDTGPFQTCTCSPTASQRRCTCCGNCPGEYECPGKPYAGEEYCGHFYCDACIGFCRNWMTGQLVPVCKCCATFQPIPPGEASQEVKFLNKKEWVDLDAQSGDGDSGGAAAWLNDGLKAKDLDSQSRSIVAPDDGRSFICDCCQNPRSRATYECD